MPDDQLRYLDGGERCSATMRVKLSSLEPDTVGREIGEAIARLLQRAPELGQEAFWLEGFRAPRKRTRGWPAGKAFELRITWCRDPDKAARNREREHSREGNR